MKKNLPSAIHHPPSARGFTLIELLVVIAVIAILTTLLMANFVGIRQRGRDGQRKANVNSIQSSLELYRADEGSYPVTASFPECGEPLAGPGGTVYMNELPCDPLSEDGYIYSSVDGSVYSLTACLENENDGDKDDVVNPTCTTPSSYTKLNP